ncbi:MAG: methyl-accepting chemotaxis protein [Hydrogenoanaerobacterium sp.]
MKIGKKLVTAFVVVAILASISGIISSVLIRRIDSQYRNAMLNYGIAQGDIGNAMLMLSNSRRCTRDLVNYDAVDQVIELKKELKAANEKYALYAEALSKTLETDKEKQIYANIENLLPNYIAKRDEVIKLGSTTDKMRTIQARTMVIDEFDPVFNSLYTEYQSLMELKVQMGNELTAKLSALGRFSLALNIALVAVALFLSIALGIYIARGISKPVRACAERLILLSHGDLHTEVMPPASNDETGMMLDSLGSTVGSLNKIVGDVAFHMGAIANGDLSQSFSENYPGDFAPIEAASKKIIVSLNDTLRNINSVATEVSSGSEQVSQGAQSLSHGAAEQSSAVDELAATMTELSVQIDKSTEGAASASVEAENVGIEILESNEKMMQMIDAMTKIREASNEIGKVIKAIEDIAFQTNILALNASIEAARAGVAGRGFAVVADEVRNLAGKSAAAADGTSELIQNTIKLVGGGSKIADDTAQSLFGVVERAREMAEIVDNIASVSREQSSSITQLTARIDQISGVVQLNSATAQQSAAASEELSGQAQFMKSLVSKFVLCDVKTADVKTADVSVDEGDTDNLEAALTVDN